MRQVNVKLASMSLSALFVVGTSFSVMADQVYQDSARVISVTPQIARVNNPSQVCRTEYVHEASRNNSPIGAVLGGVAGGLVGSAIGRGNERVVTTTVGAGIGAVIGSSVDNNQRGVAYVNSPVEHCYTADNWQEVNRGYLVTYRYNDRDYNAMMDHQPGELIPVTVAYARNRSNVAQVTYIASMMPTLPMYQSEVVYAKNDYIVSRDYDSNRQWGGREGRREHHDGWRHDEHRGYDEHRYW